MIKAKPNPYGCTHRSFVSDLNDQDLRKQIHAMGIHYIESRINTEDKSAVQGRLISYYQPSSDRPVTILIIPGAGPDSWCDEYYYFPDLEHGQARKRDWNSIISELREL